ncbi:hypothetical protein [Nocardia vaccinii]|uniref:hypothetical protein n=1 Tax=Nocardia vaccinii TaxID=1822 RepID=UPI00082A2F8F|nr:hypothetical protein [Nocardia vaccinii]
MKTYEEYEKGAQAGRPFSNSTTWETWQWNVCLGREIPERRCVNDDGEPENNCPLILLMLDDKTPAQWHVEHRPHCTEKTTPAEARRAEREAQEAADKAALEAAHYPMFPAGES